jgi:hypothetical protein
MLILSIVVLTLGADPATITRPSGPARRASAATADLP